MTTDSPLLPSCCQPALHPLAVAGGGANPVLIGAGVIYLQGGRQCGDGQRLCEGGQGPHQHRGAGLVAKVFVEKTSRSGPASRRS